MSGKIDFHRLMEDMGHPITSSKPYQDWAKMHILDCCVFDSSHGSKDAALLEDKKTGLIKKYKCFHASCGDKTWQDVKALARDNGLDPANYYDDAPMFSDLSRATISYLSMRQVYAEPREIEWIIEGILAHGDDAMIHSPGGLGKSLLTLYLALILASARTFATIFSTYRIPGPVSVLFIQSENSRTALFQRIRRMIRNHPELEPALDRIFTLSQYGDGTVTGQHFLDDDFCAWLVEFIKKLETEQGQKIKVLVVDPLVSFSGVDNENDTARMRPALDKLSAVCRQVKCTPLVVHHNKKGEDEYRGASGLNDWARNRIALSTEEVTQKFIAIDDEGKKVTRSERIECIRVEHRKSNNFKMFSPFLIRITDDLHFERVAESIDPATAALCETVVQALTDMGGQSNSTNALAKVVSELTGKSASTCKGYIKQAVDHRFIQRVIGEGRGGSSYEYRLLSN